MNLYHSKITAFFTLMLLFSPIWYYVSLHFPFLGDEFYTYDIENVSRPIPYHLLISVIKDFTTLDQVGIQILRSSNLLFIYLTFYIWMFHILNSKRELFLFCLVILTSCFLFLETTYLRYYTYYLFSSTLVLLGFIKATGLKTHNKLIIGTLMALLSPFFLFVINTVQYIFYIFIVFFRETFIKNWQKVLIFTLLNIIFFFLLANPEIIWELYGLLNINNHYSFNTNEDIRGLSISTLIKPFYAIYQFIFGYVIFPTESLLVPLLFAVCFFAMIYIMVIGYGQDREIGFILFLPNILALFFTFYFFESISFPGSTLLYAKHVIFFYPLLIFLFICSGRFISEFLSNMLISVFLCAQVVGAAALFPLEEHIWTKLEKELNSMPGSQTLLITEKNSFDILQAKQIKFPYQIDYQSALPHQLPEKIILLTSDHKLYQKLSLNQNWDQGMNNDKNYDQLLLIHNRIKKDYFLTKSLVSFPTFYYLYEKRVNNNIFQATSFWGHSLKDLQLPFLFDDLKVMSSVIIKTNEVITLPYQDKLFLNVENKDEKEEFRGELFCNKNSLPLIENKNVWDIFSEFKGIEIPKELNGFSWIHKPLPSFSRRYDGSWFKHQAKVSYIDTKFCNGSSITLKTYSRGADLRLWNIIYQ